MEPSPRLRTKSVHCSTVGSSIGRSATSAPASAQDFAPGFLLFVPSAIAHALFRVVWGQAAMAARTASPPPVILPRVRHVSAPEPDQSAPDNRGAHPT